MSYRLLVALCLVVVFSGCQKVDVEPDPVLLGDYMGQTPPTDGAEIFAPGTVNRGLPCRDVAMHPDGDEILWCEQVGNFRHSVVLRSRRINGTWSEPESAPFSGDPRWQDIEPAISSDGRTLFFASNRPVEGDGPALEQHAVWIAEHDGYDWGAPRRLPDTVNGGDTFFPSPTRDGTLYITRNLPDRTSAIYRCRLVDGDYAEAELLPEQVNAGRTRFNAMIAPDESYLIVPIFGLDDSLGGTDYYLVRRNPDDTWLAPVHLGPEINSASRQEWSTALSPDGAYLFFMTDRPDTSLGTGSRLTPDRLRDLHNSPGTGQTGIWWIPTSRILAIEDS